MQDNVAMYCVLNKGLELHGVDKLQAWAHKARHGGRVVRQRECYAQSTRRERRALLGDATLARFDVPRTRMRG